VAAETRAAGGRICTSYDAVSAGTIFALLEPGFLDFLEPPMGEVIRFIPKAELERARLIREARANYDRIFPSADQASERQEPSK
jgi:hypothetical protein